MIFNAEVPGANDFKVDGAHVCLEMQHKSVVSPLLLAARSEKDGKACEALWNIF